MGLKGLLWTHEVTQRHTFPIPGNWGIGVEFQGHLVCLKGVLVLSLLVIEFCLPQTVTEEGHLFLVPLQFQFGLLAGLLYLFQGTLQYLLYFCLFFVIHNSAFGLTGFGRRPIIELDSQCAQYTRNCAGFNSCIVYTLCKGEIPPPLTS